MRLLSFFGFTVLVLSVCCVQAQTNVATTTSNSLMVLRTEYIPSFTDAELRERINNMRSAVVPPRFTNAVKSYINTYTVKRREKTENMLGRTVMYFPIFEKYLKEKNAPIDLKYLSVVESALEPTAISRSGAAGLWQFMIPTGRSQGLSVNSVLDERRDPHKSTLAAIDYLLKQYRRYGDWELALAAYNGGPGRVNRAIKRGRSKNFWRIKKYLPRETRNYIPAFIAATYILKYYHLHNLVPNYPDYDYQLTELITIYNRLSFHEIQSMTGAPFDVIKKLNPSYKRNYIPSKTRGNNLVLPQKYMSVLVQNMGRPDSDVKRLIPSPIPAPNNLNFKENYTKTIYIVQAKDNLDKIAKAYGCSAYDLRRWNNLSNPYVYFGQRLNIYTPKITPSSETLAFQEMLEMPSLDYKARIRNNRTFVAPKTSIPGKKRRILKYDFNRAFENDNYIYYQIRRNETLMDIADKYKDVTLEDLINLNHIRNEYKLKPGAKIKIKKK